MRVTVRSPKENQVVHSIFVAQGTYEHPRRVVAMATSSHGAFLGESLIGPGEGGTSKLWAVRFSGPGHTGLPPGRYTLVAFDVLAPLQTMSKPVHVRVRLRTVSQGAPVIDYPDNNESVLRDFCASGTYATPANVVCTMRCSQMGAGHGPTTGTPPFGGDLGASWVRNFMMGSRINCTPLDGTGGHNNFTCRAADGGLFSETINVKVTESRMKPRPKPKKKKK